MESTLDTLGNSLPNEVVVMDIGQWYPTVTAALNLLPENSIYPDDETIIKMILSMGQSRFSPTPQVLRAKCEDIFKEATPDVRDAIFTAMLTVGLTIIETYNHLDLWSANGYAMYEFDRFINRDTVALRKIRNFSNT